MKKLLHSGYKMFVYVLSLSFLSGFVLPDMLYCFAQESSIFDRAYSAANEKYQSGQFVQAIEILNTLLNQSDLSDAQKVKAFKLLGLAYIADDIEEEAKRAIGNLIRMVPNYQPSDDDPPQFRVIVEQEKARMQREQAQEKQRRAVTPTPSMPAPMRSKKSSTKKWYYISGAVVAVGVIAAVLLSGGGGNGPEKPSEEPLPGPPALPTQASR